MKFQVRKSVFETNSSSVHTLTMCSDSDYEKWKNGEILFDRYTENLISVEKIKEDVRMNKDYEDDDSHHPRFMSHEKFFEYFENSLETYHITQKVDGITVHAVGYYGHD